MTARTRRQQRTEDAAAAEANAGPASRTRAHAQAASSGSAAAVGSNDAAAKAAPGLRVRPNVGQKRKRALADDDDVVTASIEGDSENPAKRPRSAPATKKRQKADDTSEDEEPPPRPRKRHATSKSKTRQRVTTASEGEGEEEQAEDGPEPRPRPSSAEEELDSPPKTGAPRTARGASGKRGGQGEKGAAPNGDEVEPGETEITAPSRQGRDAEDAQEKEGTSVIAPAKNSDLRRASVDEHVSSSEEDEEDEANQFFHQPSLSKTKGKANKSRNRSAVASGVEQEAPQRNSGPKTATRTKTAAEATEPVTNSKHRAPGDHSGLDGDELASGADAPAQRKRTENKKTGRVNQKNKQASDGEVEADDDEVASEAEDAAQRKDTSAPAQVKKRTAKSRVPTKAKASGGKQKKKDASDGESEAGDDELEFEGDDTALSQRTTRKKQASGNKTKKHASDGEWDLENNEHESGLESAEPRKDKTKPAPRKKSAPKHTTPAEKTKEHASEGESEVDNDELASEADKPEQRKRTKSGARKKGPAAKKATGKSKKKPGSLDGEAQDLEDLVDSDDADDAKKAKHTTKPGPLTKDEAAEFETHLRAFEEWIMQFAQRTGKSLEYLWNLSRIKLKLKRDRTLWNLFQERWALENTRSEGESLNTYHERRRRAYNEKTGNMSRKQRKEYRKELLEWADKCDEELAKLTIEAGDTFKVMHRLGDDIDGLTRPYWTNYHIAVFGFMLCADKANAEAISMNSCFSNTDVARKWLTGKQINVRSLLCDFANLFGVHLMTEAEKEDWSREAYVRFENLKGQKGPSDVVKNGFAFWRVQIVGDSALNEDVPWMNIAHEVLREKKVVKCWPDDVALPSEAKGKWLVPQQKKLVRFLFQAHRHATGTLEDKEDTIVWVEKGGQAGWRITTVDRESEDFDESQILRFEDMSKDDLAKMGTDWDAWYATAIWTTRNGTVLLTVGDLVGKVTRYGNHTFPKEMIRPRPPRKVEGFEDSTEDEEKEDEGAQTKKSAQSKRRGGDEDEPAQSKRRGGDEDEPAQSKRRGGDKDEPAKAKKSAKSKPGDGDNDKKTARSKADGNGVVKGKKSKSKQDAVVDDDDDNAPAKSKPKAAASSRPEEDAAAVKPKKTQAVSSRAREDEDADTAAVRSKRKLAASSRADDDAAATAKPKQKSATFSRAADDEGADAAAAPSRPKAAAPSRPEDDDNTDAAAVKQQKKKPAPSRARDDAAAVKPKQKSATLSRASDDEDDDAVAAPPRRKPAATSRARDDEDADPPAILPASSRRDDDEDADAAALKPRYKPALLPRSDDEADMNTGVVKMLRRPAALSSRHADDDDYDHDPAYNISPRARTGEWRDYDDDDDDYQYGEGAMARKPAPMRPYAAYHDRGGYAEAWAEPRAGATRNAIGGAGREQLSPCEDEYQAHGQDVYEDMHSASPGPATHAPRGELRDELAGVERDYTAMDEDESDEPVSAARTNLRAASPQPTSYRVGHPYPPRDHPSLRIPDMQRAPQPQSGRAASRPDRARPQAERVGEWVSSTEGPTRGLAIVQDPAATSGRRPRGTSREALGDAHPGRGVQRLRAHSEWPADDEEQHEVRRPRGYELPSHERGARGLARYAYDPSYESENMRVFEPVEGAGPTRALARSSRQQPDYDRPPSLSARGSAYAGNSLRAPSDFPRSQSVSAYPDPPHHASRPPREIEPPRHVSRPPREPDPRRYTSRPPREPEPPRHASRPPPDQARAQSESVHGASMHAAAIRPASDYTRMQSVPRHRPPPHADSHPSSNYGQPQPSAMRVREPSRPQYNDARTFQLSSQANESHAASRPSADNVRAISRPPSTHTHRYQDEQHESTSQSGNVETALAFPESATRGTPTSTFGNSRTASGQASSSSLAGALIPPQVAPRFAPATSDDARSADQSVASASTVTQESSLAGALLLPQLAERKVGNASGHYYAEQQPASSTSGRDGAAQPRADRVYGEIQSQSGRAAMVDEENGEAGVFESAPTVQGYNATGWEEQAPQPQYWMQPAAAEHVQSVQQQMYMGWPAAVTVQPATIAQVAHDQSLQGAAHAYGWDGQPSFNEGQGGSEDSMYEHHG